MSKKHRPLILTFLSHLGNGKYRLTANVSDNDIKGIKFLLRRGWVAMKDIKGGYKYEFQY